MSSSMRWPSVSALVSFVRFLFDLFKAIDETYSFGLCNIPTPLFSDVFLKISNSMLHFFKSSFIWLHFIRLCSYFEFTSERLSNSIWRAFILSLTFFKLSISHFSKSFSFRNAVIDVFISSISLCLPSTASSQSLRSFSSFEICFCLSFVTFSSSLLSSMLVLLSDSIDFKCNSISCSIRSFSTSLIVRDDERFLISFFKAGISSFLSLFLIFSKILFLFFKESISSSDLWMFMFNSFNCSSVFVRSPSNAINLCLSVSFSWVLSDKNVFNDSMSFRCLSSCCSKTIFSCSFSIRLWFNLDILFSALFWYCDISSMIRLSLFFTSSLFWLKFTCIAFIVVECSNATRSRSSFINLLTSESNVWVNRFKSCWRRPTVSFNSWVCEISKACWFNLKAICRSFSSLSNNLCFICEI